MRVPSPIPALDVVLREQARPAIEMDLNDTTGGNFVAGLGLRLRW
jgi:hypothetical protein